MFSLFTLLRLWNKTTKLRKLQLNWESEMESNLSWLVLPLYRLFDTFTFAFHFKAIPPSFFLLPIFLLIFCYCYCCCDYFKRCHPPFRDHSFHSISFYRDLRYFYKQTNGFTMIRSFLQIHGKQQTLLQL